MIFRREEGKACIRYAHAAFAFPAKPVTHVSEHLSPMCPVSTQSLPYRMKRDGKLVPL